VAADPADLRKIRYQSRSQAREVKKHKKGYRTVERTDQANSPVVRLGVSGFGNHFGVVVLEVSMHRGGASAAGYERLAAILAARLGDFVVSCSGEVEPNRTYGPTASGDVTVRRGGRKLGRNDDSRRGRSGEGRRALGSSVMNAGGNVSGVCSLHHDRL
jgi:hypothetical protein